MDHDIDHGMAMDHMNDVPEIHTNLPESLPSSQIPESQSTQSEGEISQFYEGAPQQVNLCIFQLYWTNSVQTTITQINQFFLLANT